MGALICVFGHKRTSFRNILLLEASNEVWPVPTSSHHLPNVSVSSSEAVKVMLAICPMNFISLLRSSSLATTNNILLVNPLQRSHLLRSVETLCSDWYCSVYQYRKVPPIRAQYLNKFRPMRVLDWTPLGY